MYILSQNKCVLLKADRAATFEIYQKPSDKNWTITAYIERGRVHLGEYKYKSQADEVMQALSKAITDKDSRLLVMPVKGRPERRDGNGKSAET